MKWFKQKPRQLYLTSCVGGTQYPERHLLMDEVNVEVIGRQRDWGTLNCNIELADGSIVSIYIKDYQLIESRPITVETEQDLKDLKELNVLGVPSSI